MYYIVIKANFLQDKNINHFLEWFKEYREEQKRWGVVSAKVFGIWFGGSHQLTCFYGVDSIDRWNDGVDSPTGLKAIFAVGDIVNTKSLQFEVVKEIPVDF